MAPGISSNETTTIWCDTLLLLPPPRAASRSGTALTSPHGTLPPFPGLCRSDITTTLGAFCKQIPGRLRRAENIVKPRMSVLPPRSLTVIFIPRAVATPSHSDRVVASLPGALHAPSARAPLAACPPDHVPPRRLRGRRHLPRHFMPEHVTEEQSHTQEARYATLADDRGIDEDNMNVWCVAPPPVAIRPHLPLCAIRAHAFPCRSHGASTMGVRTRRLALLPCQPAPGAEDASAAVGPKTGLTRLFRHPAAVLPYPCLNPAPFGGWRGGGKGGRARALLLRVSSQAPNMPSLHIPPSPASR